MNIPLFPEQLYRDVDQCAHTLGITVVEFTRQAVEEKMKKVNQQYADEWEAYCRQHDDDMEAFHNS